MFYELVLLRSESKSRVQGKICTGIDRLILHVSIFNLSSLEAKIARLEQENTMLKSMLAKAGKAGGIDLEPECEFLSSLMLSFCLCIFCGCARAYCMSLSD